MLPTEPFKSTARITPEQAERLFPTPREFRVAFNRLTGQQMAVLPNGVKLFTALGVDEGRIYWLQGSGATPGSDVEQILEELNAGKIGLVVRS
ncbi:MAG: hypothetical protein HY603_00440 [Parcubacteria group bacterium]|nr:hypothetical protein [Parcubacteria group bacterium]MBI4217261.1 hypothetical protein [Parcubacteria group bacterium]